MTLLDGAAILASTLRLSVPLVLAALGGVISERAGIVALGLEGLMLLAACVGGTVAALSGSPVLALALAMLAAAGLALAYGGLVIRFGGDQVVCCMALNLLIAGLAPSLALGWFGAGGSTPALTPAERFMPISLTGLGLPDLLARLFEGQTLLAYLTLILPGLVWWLLERSRFGLRLTAVGEAPDAVAAAGLSVTALRVQAVLLCGLLSGLAGASLALDEGAGFTRDMTGGRGYVALAAVIFGKWRVWPVTAAALIFAFADAVQLRLQGVEIPLLGVLPAQWVEALPYLVTLVLLAGFGGRSSASPAPSSSAPLALGRPFLPR